MFEFTDDTLHEKFDKLWYALDGTQKCAEDPDSYVENWTGRPIPESVAAELCEGCPFLEDCRDYAVSANEEHGIWGGTTPEMRRRINGS